MISRSARPARSAVPTVLTVMAAVVAVALPAAAAPTPGPWPGESSTRVVDRRAYFGTDVSGLHLKVGASAASDVLWAVDDRVGVLLRLVQRDGVWVRDSANGWGAGKRMTFADGRRPDAEGVVVVDGWAYVSTERDGTGAARASVIRVPTSGTAATLVADREWSLNPEFPGIGPNVGLEAITFVPDAVLTAAQFRDDRTGARYDPASYPDRVGGGLFLVAAEAASTGGEVRAYALRRNGTFTRVARIANPLGLVMDLEFDASTRTLWMACDDDCQGKVAVAALRANGDGTTSFVADVVHARPSGLPNHNNEGFTLAPTSRCVNGSRPAYWSNDANDGGHALRRGSVRCAGGSTSQPLASTVRVQPVRVGAGRRARVTVTVAARGAVPDGDVRVSAGTKSATASLVDGRAVLALPAFAGVGRRSLVVGYTGDGEVAASTVTTTLDVTRAQSRMTTSKAGVRVRAGTKARLVARLRTDGVRAPGKITVRINGKKVAATLTRKGAKVVVRTPVLRTKGLRKVKVRYAGSRSTAPAAVHFRVRVR